MCLKKISSLQKNLIIFTFTLNFIYSTVESIGSGSLCFPTVDDPHSEGPVCGAQYRGTGVGRVCPVEHQGSTLGSLQIIHLEPRNFNL